MDFILIGLKDCHIDALVLLTQDEVLGELGEWLAEDYAQNSYSNGKERSLLIYQLSNELFIRSSGNFVQNWQKCNGNGSQEYISEEPDEVLVQERKYPHLKDAIFLKAFSELKQQPDFLKLRVQAKFLSGRTYFTPEEKPILNSWLRDSDRVSLFEFFRDKVLEYKDDTNRSFTDSIL